MPKLYRLKRPDEEKYLAIERHHQCYEALLWRNMHSPDDPGFDDIDLLMYPVGLVGEGMPYETPFEVEPLVFCEACLRSPIMMCEWDNNVIIPMSVGE